MNTKKVSLYLLSLLLTFSFVEKSCAVPAIPSPTCTIDATILSLKEISKLNQASKEYFYYYTVKLKINNSSIDKQIDDLSCDKFKNSETEAILSINDYDKYPIQVGQKIKANIKFDGDERFNGNFLTNIEILEDSKETIKSSTEIIATIIGQKQITSIESIEFDNSTYNITGYKNTKLLQFIPIEIKLQLSVDARTGIILSRKKPWWYFLTN
jgi:hypothetical protein